MTRKLAEPVREEMANERGASHVCVLWQGNPRKPARLAQMACPVSGLQVHIVKATREIPALAGSDYAGLRNGLSRMKGNFHVRF